MLCRLSIPDSFCFLAQDLLNSVSTELQKLGQSLTCIVLDGLIAGLLSHLQHVSNCCIDGRYTLTLGALDKPDTRTCWLLLDQSLSIRTVHHQIRRSSHERICKCGLDVVGSCRRCVAKLAIDTSRVPISNYDFFAVSIRAHLIGGTPLVAHYENPSVGGKRTWFSEEAAREMPAL